MSWKYTFASVVGVSHVRGDIPCQDYSDCRVLVTLAHGEILVAVVADGAGSAQQSHVGAELACNLFQEEMGVLFIEGGELSQITRMFVSEWLTRFQNEVATRAEAAGLQPRDFACTLLAAVLTADAGVFVQVGDGAIVVSCQDDPEEFAWIFWPDKGEYANVTSFATQDDVHESFYFEHRAETFTEIALFTDGLERLALHFQTNSVHSPFFQAMFGPMRVAEAGHSPTRSEHLAAFLNSPQVNQRTDDDKTLLLATRRAGPQPIPDQEP